jgi:hypothetical protein
VESGNIFTHNPENTSNQSRERRALGDNWAGSC